MLGDGESDGYTNDAPDESADAATYKSTGHFTSHSRGRNKQPNKHSDNIYSHWTTDIDTDIAPHWGSKWSTYIRANQSYEYAVVKSNELRT